MTTPDLWAVIHGIVFGGSDGLSGRGHRAGILRSRQPTEDGGLPRPGDAQETHAPGDTIVHQADAGGVGEPEEPSFG